MVLYPKPQFDGFYQPGAAAPLNSDEAEEAEEAEPAAEEPTPDPTATHLAAVSTDTPADPEIPLDYFPPTNAPDVQINVADGFDPATITKSPLSYFA